MRLSDGRAGARIHPFQPSFKSWQWRCEHLSLEVPVYLRSLEGKHCGQPEVLGRTVGVKCMKSNTPCHIPEVRPRAPSDPKRKCSNCFLPRKPSKACFWKTQSRGRKRWEDKFSPMDTKHWESTSDVSAHAHQGLAQLQGPAVAARGAGPCLTPLCFTCCSPLG